MEEQEHGTATLAESALGAGTANTSEPEFIKYLEQTNAAPEVIAEARKRAERRQALETAQRGRGLQAAKNTLRQYGYTDADIDKL